MVPKMNNIQCLLRAIEIRKIQFNLIAYLRLTILLIEQHKLQIKYMIAGCKSLRLIQLWIHFVKSLIKFLNIIK